jgi:hypothetical protein
MLLHDTEASLPYLLTRVPPLFNERMPFKVKDLFKHIAFKQL